MKHITYTPQGTCSRQIDFDIDDEGRIRSLVFTKGCAGNTRGVSRLCEGRPADEVADLLEGTPCGPRPPRAPTNSPAPSARPLANKALLLPPSWISC